LGLKAGDDEDDARPHGFGQAAAALPGLGERPAFGDLGDFQKRAGDKRLELGLIQLF
jgi:hypothetical protein